jgi:hypothetical protein
MPQNLYPVSFKCPQPGHFKAAALATLLSALRWSRRTPHIPQNLFSARFSDPQKLQIMN